MANSDPLPQASQQNQALSEYELGGDVYRYLRARLDTPNFLTRFEPLAEWFDARLRGGVDAYGKFTDGPIDTKSTGFDRAGRGVGADSWTVNFASQDYLSLSSHPQIKQAAKSAIDAYGVHSAGSSALMGNTALSRQLEARIAEFTGYADATVFPTGWGAGFGIIRALIQPSDHIIIDKLAHACLMEGARLSTKNVRSAPHLDNGRMIEWMREIRKEDPNGGILVVTESLFSMDATTPDIRQLQEACREHDATLLVDCAHDLGAIGPSGRGHLELQNYIGCPDILMGSFSKTFASNGGFVATNDTNLKLGLRFGCGP